MHTVGSNAADIILDAGHQVKEVNNPSIYIVWVLLLGDVIVPHPRRQATD